MKNAQFSKGFTLIELLVVIAVLGVLAAGVFTAINPLDRLAQARDAQRKANISQLANALQNYYVSHVASNNPFPANSDSWINDLVSSGDLKNAPPSVPNTSGCLGGVYVQNDYCYYNTGTNAYTMIPLESQTEKNKCAAGANPYYMFDSGQGKVGVACVPPPSWSLGGYTLQP